MTTAQRRPAGPPPGGRHPASKVPEVTAFFWITKVLTTGMGESTSDFLVHRIDPVIAVGLGAAGLAVALALQFFRRTYSTWIYWLAVVMVAIFGTMAADVLHIRFRIPYPVTSTFFAITLAAIFVAWYATERTLSIHSIFTRRREVFYWATVMATFALGTAVGDLTAYTLGLGYFTSAVVFAVVIAIPGIAYRWLGLNAIVAFWSAYVVTRPLGASLADWVSVPHWRGGLGFGWGTVSVVLTLIIIGFVGYLAISGKDIAPAAAPMEPGPVPPRRGSGQPYAGQPHQVPEYFSAPTAYPHSPPPQRGPSRQPVGVWERAGAREPTGDWQPAGPWQLAGTRPRPEAASWSEARPGSGARPGSVGPLPAGTWPSPGTRPRYREEQPADGQPRQAPPPGRPDRPARGGRHRAPRS
jgi:uncharacterized membrane-anchored protein